MCLGVWFSIHLGVCLSLFGRHIHTIAVGDVSTPSFSPRGHSGAFFSSSCGFSPWRGAQLLMSGETNDYVYYTIPNPWLSIKLLRLLQVFPYPGSFPPFAPRVHVDTFTPSHVPGYPKGD